MKILIGKKLMKLLFVHVAAGGSWIRLERTTQTQIML